MVKINLDISSETNSELSEDRIKTLRRFVIGSLWYPDEDSRHMNPEGKWTRVGFGLTDPEFKISDIFRKCNRMKRRFRRKFPDLCMVMELCDKQLVNY